MDDLGVPLFRKPPYGNEVLKILETSVLRRITCWEHSTSPASCPSAAAANKPNPAVDGARRVAAKVKGKALAPHSQLQTPPCMVDFPAIFRKKKAPFTGDFPS